MDRIIFTIYRWILAPFLTCLVYLLGPVLRGKLKEILKDRRQRDWIFVKKTSAKLTGAYLIHAASGEIEYARSVIRELKKKYPEAPIVVTYSSPSAKKILKNLTEVDAWGPLPWDNYFSCRNFLKRVQPKAVLYSRTDVWPEFATQVQNRKIPSYLFSATFAENSSRLSGLSQFLTQWSLKHLDRIFVVDTADLESLRKIDVKAEIGGDTRFDQVVHRLHHPQPVKESLKPGHNLPVFIAGSTWPEDEAVLLPWFIKNKDKVRLLIAPHEISEKRLSDLKGFFEKHQITSAFYSKNDIWNESVLILDQIGILAELYTWGDLAFVGGSFKKQVHSVMEPLAAGLPVCIGPYNLNNREAQIFKKEKLGDLPLVFEVRSESDLSKFYLLTLKNLENLKKDLQKRLTHYQGATQKLISLLSEF